MQDFRFRGAFGVDQSAVELSWTDAFDVSYAFLNGLFVNRFIVFVVGKNVNALVLRQILLMLLRSSNVLQVLLILSWDLLEMSHWLLIVIFIDVGRDSTFHSAVCFSLMWNNRHLSDALDWFEGHLGLISVMTVHFILNSLEVLISLHLLLSLFLGVRWSKDVLLLSCQHSSACTHQLQVFRDLTWRMLVFTFDFHLINNDALINVRDVFVQKNVLMRRPYHLICVISLLNVGHVEVSSCWVDGDWLLLAVMRNHWRCLLNWYHLLSN